MRVWPGHPYPLGATWDGAGVNFALFSENATKVELCLFDSRDATAEAHRIPLQEHTDKVWHAYLPDVLPGQLYGYRVHGPYEPAQGASLQSEQGACSTRTPSSIGRDVQLGRRALRLQDRRPGKPTSPSTTATAPRMPRWPSVVDPPSPGATTGRPAPPGTRR